MLEFGIRQAGAYRKDMIKGNPVKRILAFAISVLLGNIFQQFYTMADIMMVDRILGVSSLAAISNLMIKKVLI